MRIHKRSLGTGKGEHNLICVLEGLFQIQCREHIEGGQDECGLNSQMTIADVQVKEDELWMWRWRTDVFERILVSKLDGTGWQIEYGGEHEEVKSNSNIPGLCNGFMAVPRQVLQEIQISETEIMSFVWDMLGFRF